MVLLQHEIPLESIEYVIDLCYRNQIPVILNPAPARSLKQNLIEKVTYLTPNEHEARILFGAVDRDVYKRQMPGRCGSDQGGYGSADEQWERRGHIFR